MKTNVVYPDPVYGLSGKHREIVRLYALGTMKKKEIAEKVGVTPQLVSNILRTNMGMGQFEELENRLDEELVHERTRIKKLVPKAVDRITAIMNGEATGEIEVKPSDQFKAAKWFAGVAGLVEKKEAPAETEEKVKGKVLEMIKKKMEEKRHQRIEEAITT